MLNGEFSQEEMGRISGIAAKNEQLPMSFDGVKDCAKVLQKAKPSTTDELSNDALMSKFRSKNKK